MPRSPDTSREAEAIQLSLFRAMTPGRRTEISAELSIAARATTLAGIRRRHPEYDAETARWALFRLLVGDPLFAKVWPHAPLVEP